MMSTFYKGIFVVFGTESDTTSQIGGIYNLEKDAIARRDELNKADNGYLWEVRIYSMEKPLTTSEYAELPKEGV